MNESNTSYKELHENFMKDHKGTGIWENITLITPTPCLIHFACVLQYNVENTDLSIRTKNVLIFFLQFLTIISIFVLNLTILSEFVVIISFIYFVIHVIIFNYYFANTAEGWLNLPRKRLNPIRPYVTYFRAIISVISCICILAVDFKIFPRRYAKTESYGFGLMDNGVGLFIAVNGLVYKQRDKRNLLLKAFLSSAPVLILGIIRYISLQGLNYQQHVTEYGVHWNFFFTLAFVKLFSAILIKIFPDRTVIMALSIGILHQIILSLYTESWVISDLPRTDFLSANREGLASLPGYISLYIASVAMGKLLTNLTSMRPADDVRHSVNTFVLSSVFLIITGIFSAIFDVSRRLANITYVVWILTLSLYAISLSIFAELTLRLSFGAKNEPDSNLLTPHILQAVNNNNLFYFLLSNVLTGIVNLLVHTLYAGKIFSIAIILVYQLCSCGIIYTLYLYKIKLKFW